MCSVGDFVAISHEVDVATAMILKIEVSDGIIAPGFNPEALEILKSKKQGKFIVLKADPDFEPPEMEYRMCGGLGYMQKRNDVIFKDSHLENVVTKSKDLSKQAKLDMILASIVIKYTQSNSVGYSLNGMMIGVGAGQQSRVDCVKLLQHVAKELVPLAVFGVECGLVHRERQYDSAAPVGRLEREQGVFRELDHTLQHVCPIRTTLHRKPLIQHERVAVCIVVELLDGSLSRTFTFATHGRE